MVIPGFMGNYSEGFIKNIFNFLVENKHSVYGVKFKGHEKNEKILANPDEMVSHLKDEYLKLKKTYPLRKIIILAHSQGCAITLKSHACFKKGTKLILMAPAVFIDEIILSRIDKDAINLIKAGTPALCKVSQDKFRMLDKEWFLAYEKFSLQNKLANIKQACLIIRPDNDFIDKKNAQVLADEILQNTYIETIGNHWFDEPENSFEELAKKLLLY
jgi:esterase/lipase